MVPNLGVCDIDGRIDDLGKGLVLVDIPGLLEGAHDGVGLGLSFLRHVQRCRYSMEHLHFTLITLNFNLSILRCVQRGSDISVGGMVAPVGEIMCTKDILTVMCND